MKTVKAIAIILALILSAFVLPACKEDISATESEKEYDFETINRPETDAETAPPETDVETEKETEPETEEQNLPESPTGIGKTALDIAVKLIGAKFKFGGVGPDEFDNSGFIYYIYKEAGMAVPRLAPDMQNVGKSVAKANIEPGDLLVFANEIGGGAEFVGIYAGDGRFIACCNPDSPTDYQQLGNYWEQRFITARRIG